jgi:MFS family permease
MSRPLLFLNLAHAYDHFFLLIFPTAVLALAPAWGLSYGEALALGTAAFVTFGLGTLPAGWLGDRWSRSALMSLFFLGIGGAAILTGLAEGPITLTLGLGLIGLFASIYHPVGTALVVQNAPHSGRALGINGVFGNLGVAAAGLVTGALTQWLGWRAAFILPGVLAVLTGLVFAFGIGPAMAKTGATRPNAGPKVEIDANAQLRLFVVLGIASLFGGIVFHGTTVALPKIFEVRLAAVVDSLATIGLLVSLVFALAAVAQIVVGHLLDRVGARPLLPAVALLQAFCLFGAIGLWGWGMLAVALPMMLLVFGEIPIAAWLVGRYVAASWQSRVFALQYVLSLGVSAAVVPLISVLYERTGGFETLFLTMAAAAGVVGVAALILPRTRPEVVASPAAASS